MRVLPLGKATLFVFSLLIFPACKPSVSDSDVKTLDDLALGRQLRDSGNLCTGNPDAPKGSKPGLDDLKMSVEAADPAARKELSGVVAAGLSALPDYYIDALAALDVKFVVTPRSDKICKLGSKGYGRLVSSYVTACIVVLNPGSLPKSPELEGISLVMAPNSQIIRHNLIKLVGQLFSQVFAQRLEMKSLSGKFQFSSKKFIGLQANLAAAFLQDVAKSKLFNLDSLTPMLGKDGIAKLKTVVNDFESNKVKDPFAAIAGKDDDKIAEFLTHVTANSFDSYHCRTYDKSAKSFSPLFANEAEKGDVNALAKLTNTRMVFERFFNKSYGRYTEKDGVEAYMARLAQDIAKLKPKSASLKGGGFSLAGPGFWSRVGSSISDGAYVVKEGFVGAGQGAANIYHGTVNAGSNLVSGVSSVASTAYNDGVGVAASQVGGAISHHSQEAYSNVMNEADRIGGAYASGDIGLGTAAGRLVLSAGSNTPIIGNAAKSFNNSWDVLSETNSTGNRINYDQQTEISKQQGNVAGNAIIEAGGAYAAEAGGTVLANGLSKATQATAQGLSRGTSYIAEGLSANQSSLSGFGQAVMRGTENAAFSMEQGLQNGGQIIGHTAQHNIAAATHVVASEGLITPSVQGAFSHGQSGGGASHGPAAESPVSGGGGVH